jgi:hypothetical protein
MKKLRDILEGARPKHYLRTAIKHQGEIVLGHQGEEHHHLGARKRIPQSMRYSGDENFDDPMYGYVTPKGEFLDRRSARKYAYEHDLVVDVNYDYMSQLVSPMLGARKFRDKKPPRRVPLNPLKFLNIR